MMLDVRTRWNHRIGKLSRLATAVAISSIFGGACQGDAPVASQQIATIVVVPDPTMSIGESRQFTALGINERGSTFTITPVWDVVAGGGTVSADGVFTAGTEAGTFTQTVRATSGGVSGFSTVIVTAGPLASITITGNSEPLDAGETMQLAGIGHDAYGNDVVISPTWSVVAGGGTIEGGTGLFTAGTIAGTFPNTVSARSGAISGFATATVKVGALAKLTIVPSQLALGVGGTQVLIATGMDASGNSVRVNPSWAVVAGGGTIDANGSFVAGSVAGSFPNTIEARSLGVAAFASVTITAGALATIVISAAPTMLPAGASWQFTAAGQDASGNVITIVPVWSVVGGGGVIDGSTGVFTAGMRTGSFLNTVKVTSAGITSFRTVTIGAGALQRIIVAPANASVGTGAVQQFAAIGADAAGNVVAIVPIWSVVAGGGRIDASNGMFSAGAVAGTYTNTVQAMSAGITGFATVTVVAAPDWTMRLEGFATGVIDKQFDWMSTGAAGLSPCGKYDHEFVANGAAAYRYPEFGATSLRISNAVESGCYADQTYTSRTHNPSGETAATDGGFLLPGSIRNRHFDAEWAFASTVPNAEQPGLAVAVSPARGDATRMSFVEMVDLPDGVGVNFYDVQGTGIMIGTRRTVQFVKSTVARGLDRTRPHIIRIVMDLVNGASNDVVTVYVDGVARHTGTSWENYYWYDFGGIQFGGVPPIVNRLLFRTGTDTRAPGVAAPATRGHGFVIDNIRLSSYSTP
jgi:hypothetical protein